MGIEHMKERTPEERQAALSLAKAKQLEKAAFNKENEHLYKLDYLDAPRWAELGSKHKVRFPPHNEPCTAKGIRKMMRKTGISNDVFKEHYTSVEYFIANNPKWTLAALTGLLLEIREEV